MKLLEGVNLSHSFDYALFNNINFCVNERESAAILGVSGCGKSTFLHILCTLLKPNFGEVIYKNNSIYELSDDEKLKIRRNDFGIIFQSHYLFRGFTAYENIELSSVLTKNKVDKSLIKKLKIENVLEQKVGELSGGQQQRVSIARVLNKRPRVIFADEPTGNLDYDTANEVMNVIFDYIQEVNGALILVTHDENLATKCSNIHRLKDKVLI